MIRFKIRVEIFYQSKNSGETRLTIHHSLSVILCYIKSIITFQLSGRHNWLLVAGVLYRITHVSSGWALFNWVGPALRIRTRTSPAAPFHSSYPTPRLKTVICGTVPHMIGDVSCASNGCNRSIASISIDNSNQEG